MNSATHNRKGAGSEALVLRGAANMIASVPGDDSVGDQSRLLRDHCVVEGDHPAVGSECYARLLEEESGSVVAQVMDQAERKHEVEPAEVGVELSGIPDSKLATIAEHTSRATDVLRAGVNANVLHITEVVEQCPGTATKVEHPHTCPRAHVLPNEDYPRLSAPESSREELVDRRTRENTSDVDQRCLPRRPFQSVTRRTLSRRLLDSA